MTIIHIELSKAGLGRSGGDTCMVGLISEWKKTQRNVIYTPEHGERDFRRDGATGDHVEYICVGSYEIEKRWGILVSWLSRVWKSRRMIRVLPTDDTYVMISHSDFFPSVLFPFWMKRLNPQAKWFAFCHMLAPNPFKGYKWQFVKGRWAVPSLSGLYFWLSQRLFFVLQRRADALISVNSGYEPYLRSKNKNVAIIPLAVESGIRACADEPMPEPIYDVCFLGRFHEQKGVFEFVDVVRRIVASGRERVRAVMIGEHRNALGEKVVRRIEELGLQRQIELAGLQVGKDKCRLVRQSKVFLLPSYYESFGIVYLEAITLGVPVVEYDLPIYHDHREGVVKVPYLDNAAMAGAVMDLLDRPDARRTLGQEGQEYAKSVSWKSATAIIEELCLRN